MIIRSIFRNYRDCSQLPLLHRNQYYVLNHHYMEQIKKSMFGGNQQNTWLKTKFFLKEMKYTLVQGFKDLWADSKWIVNIYKNKSINQFTGYQMYLSWRIIVDLLKFIPYSVILIVPFAQLCLPILLWLFPNAVPSFFLFDTALDKRVQSLQHQQQQSHQVLIDKLMNVLHQNFIKQQQFTHYDFFKKDFFAVMVELNNKLHYSNFTSDQLILVLKFLGGDFFTGVATINKIVNLFTMNIPRVIYKSIRWLYYKITKKTVPPYKDPFFVVGNFRIFQFNYFPFQFVKRRYLLWQIKNKFKNTTQQDLAFEKYGIEDIVVSEIKHFTRERGFATISCYQTLKNILKNDWIKITNHPNFTDNTKLWYSVMMYNFMKQTNKDLN